VHQEEPWRARTALLLSGVFAVNVGAQVSFTTVAIHLFQLSGSVGVVGAMGVATLIPMVALGYSGGLLADRLSRRRLIVVGQLALCAASLAIVVMTRGGYASPTLLIVFTTVWAAVTALTSPARMSLIPVIVPNRQLSRANAWLTLLVGSTMFAGPVAAGAIIATKGFAAAYASDAALAAMALVCFLGVRAPSASPTAPSDAGSSDALRSLLRRRSMAAPLLLDALAMLLASPRVLFPAIAGTVAGHAAPAVTGWLFAAIAVGALLAAAVLSIRRLPQLGTRTLVWCACLWGGCVAVVGLLVQRHSSLAGAALATILVTLAVAGSVDAIASVARQTLLQSTAAPGELGRIQGILFVVGVGAPRAGDSIMGVSGEVLGIVGAAVVGGLGCVTLAWAVGRWSAREKPTDLVRLPPDTQPVVEG
jgi:MFS family permease